MTIIPRTQRRSSIRPIEYIPAEERMTEPDDNKPPYSKIPNWILDAMPQMGNAELRIVMAVARQTVGWHQAWAIISSNDFHTLTGLAKKAVLNGIDQALAHGYIERQGGQKNRSYGYRLRAQVVYLVDNFNEQQSSKLSTSDTTSCLPSSPQVVYLVDNQRCNLPQQEAPNETPKEKKEILKKDHGVRAPRATPTPIVIREAMADVCKIDLKLGSRAQKLELNSTCRDLWAAAQEKQVDADGLADRIRYAGSTYWYTHDWRGKKQEPPRPTQIREVWRAAMEVRSAKTNGHATDTSALDKLRREREEIEREWAQQQGGAR